MRVKDEELAVGLDPKESVSARFSIMSTGQVIPIHRDEILSHDYHTMTPCLLRVNRSRTGGCGRFIINNKTPLGFPFSDIFHAAVNSTGTTWLPEELPVYHRGG